MTYQEIMKRVEWGEEFSFYYKKDQYWISQNGSVRYLTRVRGSETQEFQNTQELFENGRVEGKSIFEIWEDIKDSF